MQFTGHSLPVHQSMTVPRDFTLTHFVSQARLCQWNMQLPRLWNGMFGRVEGQYSTMYLCEFAYIYPYIYQALFLINIFKTDISIENRCFPIEIEIIAYFKKMISKSKTKSDVDDH